MKTPEQTHIHEDCSSLTGTFEDHVFYGCHFNKLNGLALKNCDLNQSKFTTDRIEDMVNFTISLNCLSFQNVELSPLIFDLILCLLVKTKGNTEKRRRVLELIGHDRAHQVLRSMGRVE